MPLLTLLLTTIVCVFIAFITNKPQEKIQNPFYSYFSTEIHFIGNHYIVFILGFIVLTLLFIRSLKFDKKYPLYEKYIFPTVQVFATAIVGFSLAYVILLFIALVQLNILAIVINMNPNMAGIVTDKNAIISTLKTNNRPPEIIASDADQNKELLAVAFAGTGRDSVYGKYLLQAIPSYFIVPISKPRSSILLIDNTIIITQINSNDLQAISPLIGYLFIKQYFWGRPIKFSPKVSIMGKQEYFTVRGVDVYRKRVNITEQIKTLENSIGTVSATIQNDKTNFDSNQSITSQAAIQKDTQYKSCLADGSYALDYCKNLLNKLNNTVTSDSTDMQKWNKKLQNDQKLLSQYQYDDNILKIQQVLLQGLSENIPHEFGVFEPKDSLKIVVNTTSSHAIADYFETLVHEYLHYASYVSDKKVLQDTFFEEGLTEYFARRTIKDTVNTSTNLGYPVFVKIIGQIAKRIPESDLADIYFTKDEAGLEAALDREYGDGFYGNNRITFVTLQYASNPDQILKLANDIMKLIGGAPLKEKDLLSSYSTFN